MVAFDCHPVMYGGLFQLPLPFSTGFAGKMRMPESASLRPAIRFFLDDIICLVVMRDIEWHRAKVLYKGHANPMITYGTTYKPS